MKRYNKIVSTFTKTIDKLESLSNTCAQRISSINTNIDSLESEKANQASEGKAAGNTAKKLRELISD